MLKLIKNEYKKIFYKKYVYVILVLALIGGLGISLLMSRDYDDFYYEEYEESTLEDLRNISEADVAGGKDFYSYLSIDKYQFLMDMGYKTYEEVPLWIMEATDNIYVSMLGYCKADDYGLSADDMYSEGFEYMQDMDEEKINNLEKEANKQLEAVRAKDFKKYCQLVAECVDSMGDNPVIKEVYGESYGYFKFCANNDVDVENTTVMNNIRLYYIYQLQYEEMLKAKENGEEINEKELLTLETRSKLYEYVIENKKSDVLMDGGDAGAVFEGEQTLIISDHSFIRNITNSSTMLAFAVIFITIIAAGTIANEFSQGTIKFLLINPVKRAKIFWSKYLTCLTLLIGVLAVFFGVHVVLTYVTSGSAGSDAVYLQYVDGEVKSVSIMFYAFKQYLLSSLSAFTSMTLAIAISSFARNSAVAIAFSLAIQFVGETITEILSSLGHDWGKYLIFSNTDYLADIAVNRAPFPGQSLSFALVTIVVYLVVFLLTAYDGFTRKEV